MQLNDKALGIPNPAMMQVREIDLFGPPWAGANGSRALFVSGYRLAGELQLPEGTSSLVADLADVRLALYRGTLRRLFTSGVEIGVADGVMVYKALVRDEEISGDFLLIQVPSGESDNDRIGARDRARAIAGLAGLVLGPNAIGQPAVEYHLDLETLTRTTDSPCWKNPPEWGPTVFDGDGLERMSRAVQAVEVLEGSVRNRAGLALHWFLESSQASGVDSFLMLWIALEVVGIERGTDIRPINDSLGALYGIPTREAATRFGVGRIYGLRSRMVHDGERRGIHGRLLSYLSAIFVDVFFSLLGLDPVFAAEREQKRKDFDLEAWVLPDA